MIFVKKNYVIQKKNQHDANSKLKKLYENWYMEKKL